MTDVIDALIQATAAQVHPLLAKIYNKTELYGHYALELQEDIERLESERLALLFAEYAPVAGRQPSEYKTRLIHCDDGNIVLCGIRFRGMDISQPFVTVAATLKQLDVHGINTLVNTLKKAFDGFHPRYIQFYIPSHLDIEPVDFRKAHWDNRILASTLDRLGNSTRQAQPPLHNKCSLSLADSLVFYSRYKAAYQQLLDDSPKHAAMIELKSIVDMATWVDNGFVYLLHIDDELAGIMIVEPDSSLGMTGFYVIENMLFPKYKGQGLGKWMQRAVLDALTNRQSRQPKKDMLFGTIHFDNISAIECAKSIGREDIGGYLWVDATCR